VRKPCDGGVKHKNFFVAKTPDSESSRALFRARKPLSMRIGAMIVRDLRIQKMPAAQGFLAIPSFAGVDAATTLCNADRSSSRVLAQSAPRVRRLLRQHFLKRDDVFFGRVGVFGTECISIPECTQRT
jgi:hypothetical protein